MGWFFGFKRHLVFNTDNEIVALKLTPGNVHDTTPVPALTRDLIGKLFGDKGYIGRKLAQGNRIWSLRLLKAGSASWGSGAINSDRGCRNAEELASVRSFARSKGSSAVNHLPNLSYAIALGDDA